MLFRQLEHLVALSRDGTSCGPPKHAIRKLEEEFDVPLIRRERRLQGLTPEGERIVRWAEKILADRDSMRLEVSALRTGLTGQLSIGVCACLIPAGVACGCWVSQF